ncbi:MAG: pyridoxal-phosphate dependent enzyme [Planctomycetes bacterium]|nr:pyridoxal-phosphate dependent enzyme [Planctomycetota bacterium]
MSREALLARAPGLARLRPLSLVPHPAIVRPLDRLAHAPGALWLWDDSPAGGNKVRKLEWLLAGTLAAGKRGVLVYGPTGSNWVLAAVRQARAHGLEARAVLFPAPMPAYARTNLEATRRLADLVVTVPAMPFLPAACLAILARRPGTDVYPPGGTGFVSSLGYAEAALSLESRVAAGDLPEPSWIFVAAGTGGTAAGLAAGLSLTRLATKVAAVRVNDLALMNAPLLSTVAHRALATLARAGAAGAPRRLARGRLVLVHDFFGKGYALPTLPSERAVARAAAEEGLELETTYTGKTLAAAHSMGPCLGGPILFWNTFAGSSKT